MKLMEVAKKFYKYPDRLEVIYSFFRMVDFTAWLWGWMEFNHYFPFVTFVVLTVDQPVLGRARLDPEAG